MNGITAQFCVFVTDHPDLQEIFNYTDEDYDRDIREAFRAVPHFDILRQKAFGYYQSLLRDHDNVELYFKRF